MKIASTLNALKIRESKSWKAIDWALSPANKDPNSKLKAAEFILKRIYPEKTILEGSKDAPIRLVIRAAADSAE